MFRPCIDLHQGKVKQIVGGTLGGGVESLLELRSSDNADLLGAALPAAASASPLPLAFALGEHEEVYPGGLQLGGGVNIENARSWLDAGASHAIVTSWLFPDAALDWDRLRQLSDRIGKHRLVLDLSCRRRGDDYFVVTDRWQKFTDVKLSAETLEKLAAWCAEFLIHAVDVEGLCQGIDTELITKLAQWSPIPTTYAGGANSLTDLETVTRLGEGKIDLTIGSALDIFGGTAIRYADVVAFNRTNTTK